MKPLDLQFKHKGFWFTQLKRTENVALYAQTMSEPKGDLTEYHPSMSYEVIVVQSHNGRTIMGKEYPPAEFYPRDEDWGTKGWTVSGQGPETYDFALDKFREVLKREHQKSTKKHKK